MVKTLRILIVDDQRRTHQSLKALLAAMRVVWGRVEGAIMMNPQSRIVEAVETKEY